jgi:hypothetical protein
MGPFRNKNQLFRSDSRLNYSPDSLVEHEPNFGDVQVQSVAAGLVGGVKRLERRVGVPLGLRIIDNLEFLCQ